MIMCAGRNLRKRRVLFDYVVRGRLLRSVKALYEGGGARVKVQGMESQ